MNIDEIKLRLSSMANSDNLDFANAAQFLLQVVAAVEGGQMNVSEAAETLKDVQRQIAVVSAVDALAFKEELNTLINGLIALAGAV
jgi:hypothetical protein